MKFKLNVMLGAGAAAILLLSQAAYADAQYTLHFNRLGGSFTCNVEAPETAAVSIDTHGVLVQGPGCDGHALHTDAKSLNQFAYKWKVDINKNKEMSVDVRVAGDANKLECRDDSAGRAEAPGGWCIMQR